MVRDRRFRKNEIIYRQGDPASEVFFVKFGTVDLYVDYKTEDSKLISVVPEGKVFGELGVIEGKPRTMTSVAREDSVVTVVDKDSFPSYIEEHPNKLIVVLESLSSRIRAQSHKLARACIAVAEYAEEKETRGSVDQALISELETLAKENLKARS